MSDSKFARNQLLKHGWTEGSGLGRDESGMTEAIKVQIKNNKTGVGHDPGAEFTHHWWDHVFNKTAKAIKVGADQNGEVTLSKKPPDSKEEKKAQKKKVLYGNFVKGATLMQEKGRHVEEKEGSSSSESEEETTYKPSEEEVFQRCGRRTAHKGARHGLKLNGKLQRVQAMEAQQMLQMKATPRQPDVGNPGLHGLDTVPQERKKRKHAEQEMESPLQENSMAQEDVPKKKKKKKKSRHDSEEIESPVEEKDAANECVKKKKKKRKKERHVDEEIDSPVQNSRLGECDGKVEGEVETGSPSLEDSQSDGQCPSEGKKKKRKKCKKVKESEEEEQACESHSKKKKKKRKND